MKITEKTFAKGNLRYFRFADLKFSKELTFAKNAKVSARESFCPYSSWPFAKISRAQDFANWPKNREIREI